MVFDQRFHGVKSYVVQAGMSREKMAIRRAVVSVGASVCVNAPDAEAVP